MNEPNPGKGRPLHVKILIGLVAGIAIGVSANFLARVPAGQEQALDVDSNGIHDKLDWVVSNLAEPVGQVFLRLILMVVLPLVMSALMLGVIEIGDVRKMGKIGLRTLLLTALLSSSSVVIGVGVTRWLEPGKSLSAERRDALRAQYAGKAELAQNNARQAKPLRQILIDLIPENPVQEMVGAIDGSSKGAGMLAIMVVSLIAGIAILLQREKTAVLVQVLEGIHAVCMTVIGFAMRLAPLAVGCLLFAITARQGAEILRTLLGFILAVLLGLGLQLLVVYPLLIRTVAGKSPIWFFRNITEVMLTAFGTSSSNATLPTSLRCAEENLKLPREISRFVLTVGATGNQNGTALYEGVVVLFLAQVFGVDLTLGQQVTVCLMAILAGIGTAGVPGGSLPLIVVVLQTVGVPGAGIALILGVDRVLDMCRTVLNVTGDLALATCVSHLGHADAPATETSN